MTTETEGRIKDLRQRIAEEEINCEKTANAMRKIGKYQTSSAIVSIKLGWARRLAAIEQWKREVETLEQGATQ